MVADRSGDAAGFLRFFRAFAGRTRFIGAYSPGAWTDTVGMTFVSSRMDTPSSSSEGTLSSSDSLGLRWMRFWRSSVRRRGGGGSLGERRVISIGICIGNGWEPRGLEGRGDGTVESAVPCLLSEWSANDEGVCVYVP